MRPGAGPRRAVRATTAETRPRPVHLRLPYVGLVAVGGAVGTGLRYALVLAVPAVAGVPVAIFGINVVGAFALGLLLELLARRGHDLGWNRRLRLGLGTGVLGGFTTYSTLAADNVTLALAHPTVAIAYGLSTVVVGGIAAAGGILVSRHVGRPASASEECR